MRTLGQRLATLVAAALLGATGLVMTAAWSPTGVGLVAPASADDGGDDDGGDDDGAGDDDGGQVPAGGIPTGQGGAATPTDDDGDDDDGAGDDDGGQVPAGGIPTGQGGAAQAWTAEPASSDRSTGGGDVASVAVPAAAVGLGGLLVGRHVVARLRGAQG